MFRKGNQTQHIYIYFILKTHMDYFVFCLLSVHLFANFVYKTRFMSEFGIIIIIFIILLLLLLLLLLLFLFLCM